MEFYTYLWLREDGTPYYVGKGRGRRAFRKGSPSIDRVLIQAFPSEEDALAAEIFLIAYYGRKDLGTGILRNLTDGGDGVTNPSEKARQSCRKQGQTNVENGQLDRIRSLAGKTTIARHPNHMSEMAKIQGTNNVNSGHMERMRALVDLEKVRNHARSLGKKNVETGHIFRLGHTRYHASRGIINPKCRFCIEGLNNA
jgi:hypothetical protein